MIKPSPRGKWEKAYASSSFWLFFLALFASNVLRDEVGFWGSAAVAVVIMGLGSFALVRKAAPARKERLERDAARGVIECAIRYSNALPGSLRSRWLPGFAEISSGSLKFQPDYTDRGEPDGKVTLFSDVVSHGELEPPAKRPAEVKRDWKIVALVAAEGQLHIATGDTGVKLIEDRLQAGAA